MCSLTDLTPPSCLSSIKVWFKPLILLKNWTCKIYELALQIYCIIFSNMGWFDAKNTFFMITDFLKALTNVDEIFRWSFQFLIRFIRKDEKYICNKKKGHDSKIGSILPWQICQSPSSEQSRQGSTWGCHFVCKVVS